MPRSLHSILKGSNRVRKPAQRPPPSLQSHQQASSPSPRKKSNRKPRQEGHDDRPDDTFEERLEDVGMARLLANELTLRDVVQAMRYARSRMFTPVPTKGFNATRTAELLNYRATMPPVVTIGHLHSILSSPAVVERELAELQARGVVRRARVERRGRQGEALIETSDLEGMLRRSGVEEATVDAFRRFLAGSPGAQTLEEGALTDAQADELVRAGFLTSSAAYGVPGSTLSTRPEDRTTLTSIEHISRQASGSLSAVGGRDILHLAGGVSSRASFADRRSTLRLAIPGHGRYLKLSSAAVDWLRETLGRTKWGECPESWLRERFEGGGLYGPRWKELSGLEWEWVLGEALGLGVLELFKTGSVGRGVRAL